jgi:REP element-mobilizing transposase RayT
MGNNHSMSRKPQRIFKGLKAPKDSFGGSLLTSHPKSRRPLDSKLPTHLVLRAERSTLSTPRSFAVVNELVRNISRKHGVRLYEYANVGNHLHLLLKLRSRPSWAAFIRELTGRIAQLTNTRWKHRPYTRNVRGWRKAYQVAKEYVRLNVLEADGMISRQETKTLRDLRLIWAES